MFFFFLYCFSLVFIFGVVMGFRELRKGCFRFFCFRDDSEEGFGCFSSMVRRWGRVIDRYFCDLFGGWFQFGNQFGSMLVFVYCLSYKCLDRYGGFWFLLSKFFIFSFGQLCCGLGFIVGGGERGWIIVVIKGCFFCFGMSQFQG